jgi:hypothetical protein
MAAWNLGNLGGLYELIWAHLHLGDFEQALASAKEFDDVVNNPINITTLFVEAMMDASIRPLFLETLAQHEVVATPATSVPVYVIFGRIDDAYRVANADLEEFMVDAGWLLWVPEMSAFRQDPRFAKLVTDLGLVDYWHEYGLPETCQPAGDSVTCD